MSFTVLFQDKYDGADQSNEPYEEAQQVAYSVGGMSVHFLLLLPAARYPAFQARSA